MTPNSYDRTQTLVDAAAFAYDGQEMENIALTFLKVRNSHKVWECMHERLHCAALAACYVIAWIKSPEDVAMAALDELAR